MTAGSLRINAGLPVEQFFDLSPSDVAACSDGIDNNDAPPLNTGSDGFTDWPADPQCSSADDNSELAPGFQPVESVVVVPTVDAAGNLTIPKNVRASEAAARTDGGIYFPPGYIPDATLGMITARFQPAPGSNVNTPATGTINIDTGETNISIAVRIKLEGGSGLTALGDSCFIPSGNNGISLGFTTGTTSPPAPNTPISGTPYNRYNGSLTTVNNSFSVGTAGTCGLLGLGNDSINTAFGLPAAGGRNAASFTYDAQPQLNHLTAPPVANAGPDQFRHLDGATVTLDSTGSTDPNGDTISYGWTQTAGTPVTLSGADTAHPTFTGVTADETLTFQVTASSRDEYLCPTLPPIEDPLPPECATDSSTDTVDIHFSDNIDPVADAGPDQAGISVGKTVTLTGAASSDANLDTLSYSWTQTAGDPVVLTGANTVSPTFTAPSTGPASLSFEVTVNDGFGGIDTDSVNVDVIANQAPTANAGPDQSNTKSGQTITLTAAGSTDPDNHTLSYSWTQVSGNPVTLSDPNVASPTFVIPPAPDYVYPHNLAFSVTVNDGFGGTDDDDVNVGVTASNPVVSAVTRTPSGTVFSGDLITLGSTISNPDGGTLSYAWAQASGKTTGLSSTTAANPTFTLPANGTNAAACTSGTGATSPTGNNCPRYSLVVTNTDTGLTSGTAVALAAYASTAPTRPVANAGPDSYVKVDGGTVTLNGSGTQAQSHPLTYAWTQTGGTSVALSDATAAQPTFEAPGVTGNLTFSLVVTDTQNPIVSGTNIRTSLADTVVVNVTPDAVVANAGPDQTGRISNQTVTLDGTGSTEPDHLPLTYSWVQTSGPAVDLSDATAAQPTFVAPVVTTAGGYTVTFDLTVTNGGPDANDTATDSVSVAVVRSTPTVTVSRAPSGTVFTGDTITLTANITNPDGTNPADYTYTWTQASGHTTALSSTTTSNPTFVVPVGSSATSACTSGTGTTSPTGANCPRYTVVVTKTNTGAVSAGASLAAYASSLPGRPTANAGGDQIVESTDTVTLAGSGTQAQGRTLTYAWTQTAGDPVALSDATAATPTFTAGAPGSYTFQLITTDPLNPITTGSNQKTSLADSVTITVVAQPTIAGTVTDENGDPVQGIVVAAFDEDDTSVPTASTSTDVDGTYTLTVPSGSYDLHFEGTSSLVGEWYDDVATRDDATAVVVSSGSSAVGVDAELATLVVVQPTISGTVTDENGDPLSGVAVSAFAPADTSTPTATATTGIDGTYLLTVPDGSYALQFEGSSEYVSEWWNNVATRGEATPVVVSSGSNANEVDASLASVVVVTTGSISGTVLDGNGDPLANVIVFAVPSTSWIGPGVVTDEDGNYEISDLEPGTYAVFFAPYGETSWAGEWYNNARVRATSTPLVLEAGTTLTGIGAQLSPVASISGTVVDGNGAPVAGVVVSAYAPTDTFVGTYATTTAADGTYTLPGLWVDSYQVRFLPPSGSGLPTKWFNNVNTRSLSTPVVLPGGPVTGINAQLASLASVSGVVTDGLGAPLSGVAVRVFKTTDGVAASYVVTTGADGSYTALVPAGSYQIRFVPTAGASEWYDNSPTRGGATVITVTSGQVVTGRNASLG